MKHNHFTHMKPLFIAVSFALMTNAQAANSKSAFDFNKADSILSDRIYYQIGGGAGYMAPPTRSNNLGIAEFGIGWKANLTCGNFDIKTTVKNQLNGLTEGFKDLYSNVIESATGAVASLPAMIIQRANPQLYDTLTNGLYQGKLDFNQFKTSCEEMSAKLADTTFGKWGQMADLEHLQEVAKSEVDANKAKKSTEENQGRAGKLWIGGQKRGGEKQEPINLVEDVAKAGYNMLNKRRPLENGRIVTANCSGLLCQTWQEPKEMTEWLTNVIGEKKLITCETSSCGNGKGGVKPGVGLTPEIERENIQTLANLQIALNMDTPTPEVLAELSSPSVPITRGLLEALKDEPDVVMLSQRLSSEIAISKVVGKLLLARRAVLTGMKEINVVNNEDAQQELRLILNAIDAEIEQVRLEMDLQKSLTGNSALAILQSKENREERTGTFNVSKDDVDKRVNDLALGKQSNDVEMADADNLAIPRKNIVLPLPEKSNDLSFNPTFNVGSSSNSSSGSGAGSSSGSYSTIGKISGSAIEQATGLLKNFEGFSNKAYWDVNAYRTGYGSDTITKADGTIVKVQKGMIINKEDAERDLARRTREFANTARQNITANVWDKLSPNAQAALTSYAYNYGSLKNSQSVVKAAARSAETGDMNYLANAIRNRQVDNNGVNAKRRNQEADYILGK